MTDSNDELTELIQNALDYFLAGVPPYAYFSIEVKGLRELVSASAPAYGLNQTAEVCLIALAAYFEAFCKAQFAGVINICPTILHRFAESRKGTTIDLHHVLTLLGKMESKLGNVLSESYDFGSAKEINALYYDLLGITPFSEDEKRDYQEFLGDRNLLVHHGGIYTFKYAVQRFTLGSASELAHWASLTVDSEVHERWATFLMGMAKKIATITTSAVEAHVAKAKISLTTEQLRAVKFLGDVE